MSLPLYRLLLALALQGTTVLPDPAVEAARTVPVEFAEDRASVTLRGTLVRDQVVDYAVSAQAGQSLSVILGSRFAFFDVIAPDGEDTPVFNGATDGDAFTMQLPTTGVYVLRVYQLQDTAERGIEAGYALTVAIR